MAIRQIYLPDSSNKNKLINELNVDFNWIGGFSISQKRKNITSLHQAAKKQYKINKLLEVSTKSENEIGRNLSAFNLKMKKYNNFYTVENLFQSSKVFERGGPFKDLIIKKPHEAKKDERLRNSGQLKHFKYLKYIWNLEPKTAFYDWLYINALMENFENFQNIFDYEAFSDIEFNPNKSINCQAKSVALFISLINRKLITSKHLKNKRITQKYFFEIVSLNQKEEKNNEFIQMKLNF